MRKVQLISTSLEDALRDTKKIYLGNWCKNADYLIKDETVATYHWDNRIKLESDIQYLNSLYERILSNLTLNLNKIHKKNYSKNFWRISAGYWLFFYLSSVFDRWENITSALNQFKDINLYKSFSVNRFPEARTTREFMNLTTDEK